MLFFIFFLHLSLLPSSTLFPYTTLFRSHPQRRGQALPDEDLGEIGITAVLGDARHVVEKLLLGIGDRKSTRLNSSHQIISYAVFCLKKKICFDLTTLADLLYHHERFYHS